MLQVHQIPALKDNYFWLIQPDVQSPDCYIVDPGAAKPVYDYVKHHKLQLKGILITHHHHDHIDGIEELQEIYRVPVYGPKSQRIPQISEYIKDGDHLDLGLITIKILGIPGHTLDHIAYLIEEPNKQPLLFSGDTIFAVGCGRLFDGTAPLLYAALQKLASLPDDTLIYGGHEYTLANIEFALSIEPHNEDLKARRITESLKREQGLATLPTLLGAEKRTNPFLRCHLNSVCTAVEEQTGQSLDSVVDIFTSLRLIKDSF